MQNHEIDYQILGSEMQIAEIELDPNESAIAEAGAMMYMESQIVMETIFGDGSNNSNTAGMMGKLMGAGKRVLTGESLFMTLFTNRGYGKQKVAFAAPYPGKIIPMDLSSLGYKIICQKDSFLCAAKGVAIGMEFTKKIGTGLFGGEGFILQKLEGDGMAFANAGGTVIRKDLAPGEVVRVDTGCIVAFTQNVSYDIQMVKGVKSALFGGEGFFYAVLTGPGSVWLQSLPFSRLSAKILSASKGQQEEGSVLGGLGNFIQGNFN